MESTFGILAFAAGADIPVAVARTSKHAYSIAGGAANAGYGAGDARLPNSSTGALLHRIPAEILRTSSGGWEQCKSICSGDGSNVFAYKWINDGSHDCNCATSAVTPGNMANLNANVIASPCAISGPTPWCTYEMSCVAAASMVPIFSGRCYICLCRVQRPLEMDFKWMAHTVVHRRWDVYT
eukprot:gene10230-biopygen3279